MLYERPIGSGAIVLRLETRVAKTLPHIWYRKKVEAVALNWIRRVALENNLGTGGIELELVDCFAAALSFWARRSNETKSGDVTQKLTK